MSLEWWLNTSPLVVRIVTSLFLNTLYSLPALSQVARPGALLVESNQPAQQKVRLWNLNLGWQYGQMLYSSPWDNQFYPSTSLQASVFYRGFHRVNLIMGSSVQQDLSSQTWSSGFLFLRLNQKPPVTLNESWGLIFGTSLSLPNAETTRRTSMLGITGLHANIFSMGLEPWSLFVSYTLQYFFHEYETNLAGLPNNKWGQSFNANLNYALSPRWLISMNLGYRMHETFLGSYRENVFHSQELSFFFGGQQSLTLGHSWGDSHISLWRPNGQELLLDLMSESSSYIYLSYGLSI